MHPIPITAPGIYDITAKQYHANPCPAFSVSRSFLADIISNSPLHAHFNCSELNQTEEDDSVDSKAMRMGKAMHELALGNESAVIIIDKKDWRTNEAKEARDAALADGNIPMLTHEMEKVKKAVAALDYKFTGKNEQTYIWQRDGIWCRAMMDSVTEDGYIEDYKTTAGSAEPSCWTRNHLYGDLLDMQAAWYIEAYETLHKKPCKGFRFIVQEQKPPHAFSVVNCDLETIKLGQSRIEKAFRVAKHCLATDTWPGYGTVWATPPAYLITEWESRNAS